MGMFGDATGGAFSGQSPAMWGPWSDPWVPMVAPSGTMPSFVSASGSDVPDAAPSDNRSTDSLWDPLSPFLSRAGRSLQPWADAYESGLVRPFRTVFTALANSPAGDPALYVSLQGLGAPGVMASGAGQLAAGGLRALAGMRGILPADAAMAARAATGVAQEQPAAAGELEGLLERLYRGGGRNPGNLKPRAGETGLSFRDSLSNPIPKEAQPVFRPGETYIEIDPSKLPPEAIIRDNIPPGHVNVEGLSPQEILDAFVQMRKFPK